jgi:hypothetical protein
MTYDIHYDYRGHCLQLRGSESEVMEKGRKAFENLVDGIQQLNDMLSGQTTTIARQREELATARLQRDGLQAQLAEQASVLLREQERSKALLAENGRLQTLWLSKDNEPPKGLTINEDASLLNWLGVNYVKQASAEAAELRAKNDKPVPEQASVDHDWEERQLRREALDAVLRMDTATNAVALCSSANVVEEYLRNGSQQTGTTSNRKAM